MARSVREVFEWCWEVVKLVDWKYWSESYYLINDAKNNEMYQKYIEEAECKNVIFCGRLADYKYYDMHVVIERALNVVREELNK